MDDMVLWADDRETAKAWQHEIIAFVRATCGQQLKPAAINRTSGGMDFLGRRIHPGWAGLSRASRVRWTKRMRALSKTWEMPDREERTLQQRATALVACAAHSICRSFRQRVLSPGCGPEGLTV